tara:strand:+ start:198 stop:734 length:537 start_codon:yes stop_codon:yes gene_type:complete
MQTFRYNKNKGIVFWITGISGSGKTRIGKEIKKEIIKKYGPTILFSGDDIRKVFNIKKYSFKDRLRIVKYYCKLCKNVSNQKINIIFCVVGLVHEIHNWNKKNLNNYLEIFIKAPLNKVKKLSNKKIYKTKSKKNIVGLDIKAEYPKKPHIILNNDFSKNIKKLSKKLLFDIAKLIKR